MRIAVFPGSFDPITLGHYDIVERAAPLFDKIIVSIGVNSAKKYMFSLEKRMQWLEEAFSSFSNVEVDTYEGLTINYCKKVNSNFLLRGLRNPADFGFEKGIAHFNRALDEYPIETVFLLTSAKYSYISSSHIREIILHQGNYQKFVPSCVKISD